MNGTDPATSHWHIDRRINLTTVLTFGAMTVGLIVWGMQIQAGQETNTREILRLREDFKHFVSQGNRAQNERDDIQDAWIRHHDRRIAALEGMRAAP